MPPETIIPLGEQYDTRFLSTPMEPVGISLPSESVFPDWVNANPVVGIKDISPQIQALTARIKANTTRDLISFGNRKQGNESAYFKDFMNGGNDDRLNLAYTVDNKQTHEQLSDGSYIPKYKTYLHGTDNDARLSAEQSGFEKFINPVVRFGQKVSRGIPGDIVSFVAGVGEAVLTGRAEAVYDGKFANYLDDLDKKSDFQFKNYYTEAESNLGANLYTVDKFLGGAEFTARLIGSEALIAVATGGTSLPSSFAKAGLKLGSLSAKGAKALNIAEDIVEVGKYASKLNKTLSIPIRQTAETGGDINSIRNIFSSGLNKAASRGKLADNLVTARFALTGSSYEAGFEARHYQNEMENSFWDYHRANGTSPTREELDAFVEKSDNTAWGVFGANMAILSASNMAMFGNMLNIKTPFSKGLTGGWFDKTLGKIGTTEVSKGTFEALKPTFFNKALAYTKPFIKGALIEGVYEEGSQGIASGMYKNYVASSYDPKALQETSDYASAFSKAFSDQYSTKSGREEVVIGALIGGLMGGLGGGIQNTNREYSKQKGIAEIQNKSYEFANTGYVKDNLISLLGNGARVQKIQQDISVAQEEGNHTQTALKTAETFISLMESNAQVGKEAEFLDMIKSSFKGMDNQCYRRIMV